MLYIYAMNYMDALDQVKTYVTGLFKTTAREKLFYHNLSHTENVVENAVKMANYYQLSDRETFILSAACWFHDVGYLQGFDEHERIGAKVANDFLLEKNVGKDIVDEVVACIMATKMPQQPQGLLQEIMCDADLYHLGTPLFKEINKELRNEMELMCNKHISKEAWREQNINFLQGHHFHTTYAQKFLQAGKTANINALLKKASSVADTDTEVKKEEKKDKEVKKEKSDRPEKGIETMFRITSTNHQRLSDMADNKAHIMISTNSIILSVILSILLRKLEDNPHLILPTLILLIICVVTMVFSILATRPTIPSGTFTESEIKAKSVNLLFFGNFYKMSLPDYQKGMLKLMDDRDFLYGSLIKDLHSQGVVLGRKYRLLRVAYNVFMFGIVASVLAFMIAMLWIAI
ncbi:Pycsar system effector family protein [Pedobacter sp.]|uniref:Pycsar system effector family protein n=1 Tax=Pedobacter sp. TaxID=1411316 RepID=UPI003D7F9732